MKKKGRTGDVVKRVLLASAGRKSQLTRSRRQAIESAARRLSALGVGVGHAPGNVIDLARHRRRRGVAHG